MLLKGLKETQRGTERAKLGVCFQVLINYSFVGNLISYYYKEVFPLLHCQIDLKYSHQLIVIHERRFSGYLCDNESAGKKLEEGSTPKLQGHKGFKQGFTNCD